MPGADTFYTIGSSHRVCQDYASHIVNEDEIAARLSDGCSTAPETDWGARVLVRTAEINQDRNLLAEALAEDASCSCKWLHLSDECLSATLLEAKVYDDRLSASIIGDGVIVARYRGINSFVVSVSEFPSGAPFYPRYLLPDRDESGRTPLERYVETYGSRWKFTEHFWDSFSHKLSVFNAKNCTVGVDFPAMINRFPRENFDLVAIFSDGLHSFTRPVVTGTSRTREPVPIEEVLAELLAFKTYTGDFIARRCQAAFKKFRSLGWEHYDDFSMGAIYAP